jgi:hypothetical protein
MSCLSFQINFTAVMNYFKLAAVTSCFIAVSAFLFSEVPTVEVNIPAAPPLIVPVQPLAVQPLPTEIMTAGLGNNNNPGVLNLDPTNFLRLVTVTAGMGFLMIYHREVIDTLVHFYDVFFPARTERLRSEHIAQLQNFLNGPQVEIVRAGTDQIFNTTRDLRHNITNLNNVLGLRQANINLALFRENLDMIVPQVQNLVRNNNDLVFQADAFRIAAQEAEGEVNQLENSVIETRRLLRLLANSSKSVKTQFYDV